jgi:UDPglucose 6-dehydrogenase
VTIASTVSPGTVETIRRALEEGTGGTCGEDWGLCYSPWFISQGTVIEDFINPEITMVGSDDDRSEDALEDVLDTLIESDPTVTRMSFVSAEIAKITFNVYSTMKISFANQMGWICGRHENADVDVVMESIKHDDRIGGPKLFTAGLGFGGPCLPRDNRAFRAFTDVPERYDFGRVTDSINHAMPSMVVDQIESVADSDETVGVLGLSYKPRTDMTKESQSLVISELLADRRDAPVLTYDPKAPERNCETLGELVESVDVLLLLTPWPEFESVDAETLREKKVVDMWRFFDADIREADDDYWAFGVDFPRSRGFENLTDFE